MSRFIQINLINPDQELKPMILRDLEELANQYRGAAANEHIWALGCRTQELSVGHENNADQNRWLAEWYEDLRKEIDIND